MACRGNRDSNVSSDLRFPKSSPRLIRIVLPHREALTAGPHSPGGSYGCMLTGSSYGWMCTDTGAAMDGVLPQFALGPRGSEKKCSERWSSLCTEGQRPGHGPYRSSRLDKGLWQTE
eukprot:c8114_g1_i1 orf=1-348(-)